MLPARATSAEGLPTALCALVLFVRPVWTMSHALTVWKMPNSMGKRFANARWGTIGIATCRLAMGAVPCAPGALGPV